MPRSSPKTVRFGVFEVNLASAELRKQGLQLRLQEQPFQVLAALLEQPGAVVTREDLIRRLWPDGTNVDFDRGLNAAVTRLRQALSDSAEVPRYIETIARRGYRFIAPVDSGGEAERPAPVGPRPRRARVWLAAALISVIALSAVWWWMNRAHTSRPERSLKVVPLTTQPGIEQNPSFSPDGNQVAFEWDKSDGDPRIYIKLVGPGDPIRLTSANAAEFGPAWSRDGRQIAFLRKLDESTMGVFVIPALGGVERKVAESPSPDYWVLRMPLRRLDWTPDSRHLIVSGRERAGGAEGLFLVSIDNGEKTWLTKPSGVSWLGDREPAVSPDGSMVAFVRGALTSTETIHLMRLSGDLRPADEPRILSSAGLSRSPAWTPDGREIVFTSPNPRSFGSGLWRIGLNTDATPRELLALGRNVSVPAVAQVGRLAYSRISIDINIWQQEIPARAGAIPPPVSLIASTGLDYNAQYSPDGKRIAFGSNRSGDTEIWVCATDGTHCVQITTFNGSFVTGTPRWSPDGKRIAFDSGAAGHYDVYVLDANGGSPRRLTDDSTNGAMPSWSQDGKWIYFSSGRTGRSEIWKIPSAGGASLQVTRNGGLVAFESPDGKALYYTKTQEDAKLWRSGLDGDGETEVLNGVARRGFVVAADRVYYLRQEPGGTAAIRRFLFATGKDSRIAWIAKPAHLGLSLSPDGRYLIYSQVDQQGTNLMLVEDFH